MFFFGPPVLFNTFVTMKICCLAVQLPHRVKLKNNLLAKLTIGYCIIRLPRRGYINEQPHLNAPCTPTAEAELAAGLRAAADAHPPSTT